MHVIKPYFVNNVVIVGFLLLLLLMIILVCIFVVVAVAKNAAFCTLLCRSLMFLHSTT